MIRLIALLGLLAALSLASAASAGQDAVSCGDAGTKTTSPQDVTAKGVDCATAKRLARRHANRTAKGKRCDLRKASCSLDGWTCKRTFFGNSGTKVSCKLSFGRVTWVYGA